MNAEQHLFNIENDIAGDGGDSKNSNLKNNNKKQQIKIESVWPKWRARPDALFVYNMTADLQAGEIPSQSSSEDYFAVSL